MRLVIFGASGNCGGHLMRLAAERGHEVTAVARPTTDISVPAGATLVRGDVLDPAFVRDAVAAQDAVASCLGIRYRHPWALRQSPPNFIARATRNIVDGMWANGVRRISIISAAGVGDSRPALNWPMRAVFAMSNVGIAYADLERAEEILRDSGLDWQCVRPTTLTHKPSTGRVARVARYALWSRIPREDVAAYMLAELARSAPSERTPMIAAM